MDKYDLAIIIAEIIFLAAILVSVRLSKKYVTAKWNILCLIPFPICMALTAMNGFSASMAGAYAAAVLPLAVFAKNSGRVKAVSSSAALVCVLLTVFFGGKRPPMYEKDFEYIFNTMKAHYVLSEHKGIDWDGLYEKYRPAFAEADAENSGVLNDINWALFTAEFHDGHVCYVPESIDREEDYEKYSEMFFGELGAGDFGLSMMPYSDGRTAAVNVDPESEAARAGIHNGTVITSWDGGDIYEAAEKSRLLRTMNFADIDNERFYTPLIASVCGGDAVAVTFTDDSGNERSAVLPRTGNGYKRFTETRNTVDRSVQAANFGWVEINEDTVCFCVKLMNFDKESAAAENYSAMKNEAAEKIEEYKAAGKKNLIIDLRNNGGGSGQLVLALGELFAPEGVHYYATDALWDESRKSYIYYPETESYAMDEDVNFVGEGMWEQNPIIILVNANTVSAGDHLAMIMRGFPNIKIMGFTEPSGSAQGVGRAEGKYGTLSFSNCLLLDRNGKVFIDSGTDRESGNGVDITVPFDENAVHALFDNDEDYVMNAAVKQFDEIYCSAN